MKNIAGLAIAVFSGVCVLAPFAEGATMQEKIIRSDVTSGLRKGEKQWE